ncbi:MAG: translocase [Acidobacteriia bacterium]|nr:translocase [Terriglobia bacterium]
MATAGLHSSSTHRSILDRLLALFSVVHAGEGLSAVLLAANVFLLLGTYYVLKTVREPLILDHPNGAEIKSYASAGQALLFLLVVPLYGMIASRVDRMKLVGGVTLFFVANLGLFYVLGQAGVGIGVVYFLWVGIFSMLVVAQFWGFANDLYTEEQGKRLFPVIGVGASLGAWVGSVTAKNVYRELGPYHLMLASGAALCVCVLLTLVVHRREAGRSSEEKSREAAQPLDKTGGFQLVMRDRYLMGIALLVFLLSCVNTTGEYILGKFVTESAQSLPAADRGAFIGEFYGDYFSWVNLVGFLIQIFLVSRIFKWIGVRGALFVLPCIALGGYGILALVPVLAIVKVAKIMENSTDYSLNNTVRHALFLPTSREAKYKAKAATDTFFVRAGDMTQAAIVYGGTQLSFTVGNFAVVNIVMVCFWLLVAGFVYRQHRRLSA